VYEGRPAARPECVIWRGPPARKRIAKACRLSGKAGSASTGMLVPQRIGAPLARTRLNTFITNVRKYWPSARGRRRGPARKSAWRTVSMPATLSSDWSTSQTAEKRN